MAYAYAWPFDPAVYLLLAALLAGHSLLARGTALRLRQRLYFLIGLFLVWLALETPLATLGNSYLVTANMAQHMLLVAFASPFLLLGLNDAMAARVFRVRLLRWLTEPIVALVLYAAGMILWHLSGPFDFALEHGGVILVEHLTFLVLGLLYWSCLIRATSRQARWSLTDPQKLVLLFFGSLPMMAVALPFQFAGWAFYAPYVAAPRLNGFFSPVVDQTVAGALMMTLDMTAMAVDGLVVFFRWFNGEVNRDFRRAANPSQFTEDPEDQEALEA
ncbi:MAG: cytochrome c oxidase assembly protein, partial [Candidatus Dormiibacterota bacterium]